MTMEGKPTGMLWMMPAGTTWQVLEVLAEGRLMDGMRKSTLLDDAIRGFRGTAAKGRIAEADRWRQLVGLHDPAGVGRRLFGAGEGPAEDGAGAKQDWVAMPEICVNSVSVATGKSLQAPLVTHLSTTCNPRS